MKEGAEHSTFDVFDGEHVRYLQSSGYVELEELSDGDTVDVEWTIPFTLKDGEYILAIEAEKAYQVIDKSDYDQCRYTWKNFLPLGMTEDDIKDAEAEGVTASITITASGSGSITQSSAEVEIKSTCTFTLQSKEGSETLEAHAINGLVTDVTYTMNANGNTSMLNFAFTYDNAYVDIPDLTKWKAGGEQGGGNETEGTND